MKAAYSPEPRVPVTHLRSQSFPEITLDMQRHIVTIEDRDTGQKRRYTIETEFHARDGYCYSVSWKPFWEENESQICTGAQFDTADQAVNSALIKVEAWERWLDVSQSAGS